MIDRVLVPMDGSEMATRALEYALEVHPDAEITVLFVAGEPSPMMGKAVSMALEGDIDEAANEAAEEVFADAREIAAEYGIEIGTEVALGSPTGQIIDHAEDHDVVVIGSHGTDLRSTLFMGNVASKVARDAPVPVTVVR
jgi:nucleotide-binding universal stress UspA family protein